MCTIRGWSTGTSVGCVPKSCGHCPACNSLSLKANVLIDNNGRAYLAGFSQLAMVSDQSTTTFPTTTGGPIRWMSPELLDPDGSNPESRPTKESDCYALGMLVYEVLSGQVPYAPFNQLVAVQKILAGERPSRPQGMQGVCFTDGLWEMLELCWKAQPGDRPNLNAVLQCLQDVTRPLEPPDVESWSAAASDPGTFSSFLPRLAPK